MAELTPEMRAEMRRMPLVVMTDDLRARIRAAAEGCRHTHTRAFRSICSALNVLVLLDHCDRLERERAAAHECMREMAMTLEPFALWAKYISPSEVDHARTIGDLESALPQVDYIRRAARVLADYRKGSADG